MRASDALKTNVFLSIIKENQVLLTQVSKGSSEGKNEQRILISKTVMGMFMWFKIAKNKKIHESSLDGWWYTGRKIHQIWAEWAVCVGCYLQNGSVNISVFCNFESHKHTHNKFWSQNLLIIFSLWATLTNLGVQYIHIYVHIITYLGMYYLLLSWVLQKSANCLLLPITI